MLILVGVTVTISIDAELFKTAKEAASKTESEMERELLLESLLGAIGQDGKIDIEALDSEIPSGFEKVENRKGVYKNTATGNQFKVNAEGDIKLLEGDWYYCKSETELEELEETAETIQYVTCGATNSQGVVNVYEIGDQIGTDIPTNVFSYTPQSLGTAEEKTAKELELTKMVANHGGWTDGTYVDETTSETKNDTEETYLAEELLNLTQENLTWKIYDIKNGKLRLISTTPTPSQVCFYGARGYCNEVYLLDTICIVIQIMEKQ